MPHGLETQEWRLLRVLFIRHGAMPANSGEWQNQRVLRVGTNLTIQVHACSRLIGTEKGGLKISFTHANLLPDIKKLR